MEETVIMIRNMFKGPTREVGKIEPGKPAARQPSAMALFQFQLPSSCLEFLPCNPSSMDYDQDV